MGVVERIVLAVTIQTLMLGVGVVGTVVDMLAGARRAMW